MTQRSALIFILVAGFLATTGAAGTAAQDRTDPKGTTRTIARAIKSGDSKRLAELAAKQVEIDLGQGPSVYTSDQARYVFASFFEQYPPADFSFGNVKVLEEVSTARGRFYTIGSNLPWDAFIRLSMSDGRWRLKEIQLSRGLHSYRELPPRTIFELSPR